MMSNDILTQRQRWFRFFPEGSIEFLVATRVLALLLLLALLIVGKREMQLLAAVVALTGVLWLDYALIAPWPMLLRYYQPGLLPGEAFVTVGRGMLVVLFIVLAILAQRALQRIRLGRPLWTLLLLIPVVHWFAMHRLIVGLEARIREHEQTDSPEARDQAADSGTLAIALADVTWVLAVLPWGHVVIFPLAQGNWPAEFPQAAAPFCGVPLAAVFAVADLAAMERVQRQFTATLRKL